MRASHIVTGLAAALVVAGCARGPIDTGGFGGTGGAGGYSGGPIGGAGGLGAGTLGGGTLPGSAVSDTVLFGVDQATLAPDALAVLDQQVAWITSNPGGRIEIEGHADERGTEQYNIQLGARRAAAVRDYMVSRGIPDARIGTNTFGRARPVSTCAEESCWAQNRRAVTVVASGGGV